MIAIVFLLAVLVEIASTADPPQFNSYPARQIYKGKSAQPKFRPGDEESNHFRDGVTFWAEQGPNFAGHFTLARWTCGSGCSGAIVVNSNTGKLYRDMPFGSLVIVRDDALQPYSFRLDSRLLIVQGYFDIDVPDEASECSRRYYEWTGTSFKLLRKELLNCNPKR